MRKQTKVRIGHDGERRRVCDMHVQHLVNAVRLDVEEALRAQLLAPDPAGWRAYLPPVHAAMLADLERRGVAPAAHDGEYAGELVGKLRLATRKDRALRAGLARAFGRGTV